MPRSLIYTPRAREDLRAIRRWLTQPGSGPAAWRTLAEIRAAIRPLQHSPCQWPASRHIDIRELPCAGGYRALYKVIPDTGRDSSAGDVFVLRIYGPGQDRA